LEWSYFLKEASNVHFGNIVHDVLPKSIGLPWLIPKG
jgi:hypothetical protein